MCDTELKIIHTKTLGQSFQKKEILTRNWPLNKFIESSINKKVAFHVGIFHVTINFHVLYILLTPGSQIGKEARQQQTDLDRDAGRHSCTSLLPE